MIGPVCTATERPSQSTGRGRIAIVRPPAVTSLHAYSHPVVPPLGAAYIAAALEAAGHAVTVVDALGEAPLARSPAAHPALLAHGLTIAEIVDRLPAEVDGIGVSVMFSQQWPHVAALIRALHQARPGAVIFVGGEHPTATWHDLLAHHPEVALCVLGEGEETAVEVARWIVAGGALDDIAGIAFRRDGVPVRTPARPRIRDVDRIPPPAWHLFPLENYLAAGYGHGVNRGRSLPLLATRGCPYRCTFCSSPEMWTTRYYKRDVARVVDEIAGYVERYGISNVDFEDLTAIIDRNWILAFCAELERRGLRITYQLPSGTRSEALDEEVLSALSRTGCRNITYAPESGSPATLARIKKKVHPERLLASMKTAKRLGVNVKANLMIGFPHERRRDVLRTIAFGARAAWLGVDDIPLFPFSPYPGTRLYDELAREGRVPALGDDYFAGLGYMDLVRTPSMSRHIGTLELSFYRTAGMALFYALSYARRPGRIARTARNVAAGRSDTVLEQRLVELAQRWFRPAAPAAKVEAAPCAARLSAG